MSKRVGGYHHMTMVLLVVFLLVLGIAGIAVGVNVIPSWVEHHEMASK